MTVDAGDKKNGLHKKGTFRFAQKLFLIMYRV